MKPIFAVSTLAIAICTSVPAFAQSEPPPEAGDSYSGGLGEIVVTATKRSENLQDVPVAVSAISSEQLTNKGVFETSDLGASMPNLQIASAYGQLQPSFTIRGIGVGTELSAIASSPVGVYVDEVFQATRSSHGQQLYDLEQIEVVRGPQGTLYGRNTTGGAINFITRKPQLRGTNGYVTVGYGNYDRRNAEAAVEFTPVEDKVGIRLAGTYLNSDPYLHNVLPAGLNTWGANGASGVNFNTGRDPGGWESYGVRGTVRVKPSDALDITLKGYYAKTSGGAEASIPTGQSKSSDIVDYRSPNFAFGVFFRLYEDLLPASYSQSANNRSINDIESDTIGLAVNRAEGAVLNVKAELADSLDLISVTGYDSGLYLQSQTDCDGTPYRGCSIGYRSSFNSFNQDVRFDYHDGPFKMILGGYYGYDTIKTRNLPDFFNVFSDVRAALGLPASYFNPIGILLPAGSAITGIKGTQNFDQTRKSWAIYSEGSYEITPTLKFTAGLRYTTDKSVFKNAITTYVDDTGTARMLVVSDYADTGTGFYFIRPVLDAAGNVVVPASPAPFPGGMRRSGKTSRLTGRAIIDWKPVDQVMLYASYSRGYRAGTFNGLSFLSYTQVYFVRPEEVSAYEVGFKTRFLDNRLQINGSLFYYDYVGQQTQAVDTTGTANLIALDGKLKGLEIDVQFAATERLKLNAGFGLLDTKFDAYDQDACATKDLTGRFPVQDGSCILSGAGNVSVGGNPFPYAAKSSINLGFDWDALDVGNGLLKVHGDASYIGHFYFDSFKDYSRGVLTHLATGRYTLGEGDYWLLNGRISYVTDHYTIAAWGKNLTNKFYYTAGYPNEAHTAQGYRVRGLPRTYGIEATLKF